MYVAADDLYQEITQNLNLKLACILLVTGNSDGGVKDGAIDHEDKI